nr:hypothetical protein Itr_chr06CG10240 [Ipomoea trifida]GLL40851.1 hypothetical protein Itr_chr12CG03440 [Ipomoea trifida]
MPVSIPRLYVAVLRLTPSCRCSSSPVAPLLAAAARREGKTHHPEPSLPSTASRRRSPLVATAPRCPRLALATARPRCLSPICSSSPYSSGNNIDLFEVCAFEAWSL